MEEGGSELGDSVFDRGENVDDERGDESYIELMVKGESDHLDFRISFSSVPSHSQHSKPTLSAPTEERTDCTCRPRSASQLSLQKKLLTNRNLGKVKTRIDVSITKIIMKFRSLKLPPYVKLPRTTKEGNDDKEGSMSSRLMDVNLDALRGLLATMSVSLARKDQKQTRSCPGSIKTSPVRQAQPDSGKMNTINEDSVEDAIAYCKTSFRRD